MFKGNELKVQLATGHEFCTKINVCYQSPFACSLEHVVNCYIINKLTTPIILGMQWL